MEKIEFSKQFGKLYMPLCMYALRLTCDTDAASDCVQDAFAAAWLNRDNICDAANFRSYIYSAVRNRCISLLRQNNNFCQMPANEEYTQPTDEEIDTSERDARLWEAINRLPEKCRTVFLMSKCDSMSNREIADELSISIKTVENQITKAYSRLRESLNYKTATHRLVFMMF